MVYIWLTQWLKHGDSNDPNVLILRSSFVAYFSLTLILVLTVASHSESTTGAILSQPHDYTNPADKVLSTVSVNQCLFYPHLSFHTIHPIIMSPTIYHLVDSMCKAI